MRVERKFASSWKIEDAIETYGVSQWGKDYFGINRAGHVTVHPNKRPEEAIDLKELVDQLQARGIQLPILLRFTDILRHRVGEIHDAFRTPSGNTSTRAGTAASIRSRSTSSATSSRRSSTSASRTIRPRGRLQARAAGRARPGRPATTPIICNGFKDDEFIETVDARAPRSANIIPVVEKFSELELIVQNTPS